jgi:hypothetical protein
MTVGPRISAEGGWRVESYRVETLPREILQKLLAIV